MAFGTLDDIQGSVELVIFPRVWSKYAQLLRSNEVLLVKGKVDNEKSDPKILVDKVEAIQLTEENIAAAGEDAPLDDAPPPFEEDFPFNEANIAEDNSLGGENYISFSTGTPKKADPAPVAYVQEVNVASEVMVADHINLDLPGSPVAPEVPPASEPVKSEMASIKPVDSKVLLLSLNSCGSHERDNRRLKQIYGFLTSTPGKDHFAFVCKENGNSYRLDFPNDNTCINDSLLREIRGIVGETNVSVEG
jgi:DNA polymerase-3 subunit alpha